MNDEVEEVKRRLDIIDLISSYLTLKKAGANYRAICPFHQEKTPSFMVSPEKQIWHCFGCGEGGDIFTFVMKMENLEFREALEMLAQKAGVILKKRKSFTPSQDGSGQKNRLYGLNNLAAATFHKILLAHPAGKIALKYLLARGLTVNTLKEFQVGYAPSSRVMAGFLTKRGYSQDEMTRAGGPERFYQRIIFPIRDVMGNTIAFTGRVLDKNQEPKYLNTPETVIFHKSRILYNLDQAKGAIKTEKAAVVVEGQMDVLASWQAGVKNVVATSGTAVTQDHLRTLGRYGPNLIFAFDSDTAGLATAKKAYEMAIAEGLNVKMVDLGDFKDPGEMIAQDPDLWLKAVSRAMPVIDWYFELAFGKIENRKEKIELTSVEKKEIAKEILPIIKKIPDSIEQAHYVSLLGKRLTVSDSIIFDALKKVGAPKNPVKPEKAHLDKKSSSSELLLGLLLTEPAKIPVASKKISPSDFDDSLLTAIYKVALEVYNKNGSKNYLAMLKNEVAHSLRVKIDELTLLAEQGDPSDIDGLLTKITLKKREDLKNYFAVEIKKAEEKKDHSRLKKLIKEFQEEISR